MSSCITKSGAEWFSSDAKSRASVDDAVHLAIGHKKENSGGLPAAISKLVVDYLEKLPRFGESEWTNLCERVDPAPPLPDDFSAIWNGPCPIYPEKKISETHMLVYIPATVDGKPFTLKKLGEIAKRFFFKNDAGYKFILPSIVDELGDKPIGKSRWVLMTRDVLPGSRSKSYTEQQKIIVELAKKSLSYKVPKTLEAATCILAQYFDSGTYLFCDNPLTYTYCKEKVQGYQTAVGNFGPAGLSVNDYDYENSHIGIAALRKL